MTDTAPSTIRPTVPCYNCKTTEHTHFLRENGFDLVRCAGCGLLYVPERPSEAEIAEATVKGRHKGEDKDLHVNVQYNRTAQSLYERILPQLFPEGFDGISSWLDVGCGHGEFLESLRRHLPAKAQLIGSEPNAAKQAAAQARGLNVTYFDLSEHETRYDVVSLMNVYSHLPDPLSFIESLAARVAPGGRLLIQTGDVTGITPETFLRPAGLPDHMTFVTEEVLADMLTRVGLGVERVVKYPSLPVTPSRIVKEIVKFVLPGRTSFLWGYRHWKTYQTGGMLMLAAKPGG